MTHEQNTYSVIPLEPLDGLSPGALVATYADVLLLTRQWQREVNFAFIEIEESALNDLANGRKIRPLFARLYDVLNIGRSADQPPREPGESDLQTYAAYWSDAVVGNALIVLAPQPAAYFERCDTKAFTEATDELLQQLATLPVSPIERRSAPLGTAAERHGFSATRRPVRPATNHVTED